MCDYCILPVQTSTTTTTTTVITTTTTTTITTTTTPLLSTDLLTVPPTVTPTPGSLTGEGPPLNIIGSSVGVCLLVVIITVTIVVVIWLRRYSYSRISHSEDLWNKIYMGGM